VSLFKNENASSDLGD